MNKNVFFVEKNEYYNEEFRIYDIGYLSNNIIVSIDLIGRLIYYEISNNYSLINKKESIEIYSTSDLDNLISLFSIDIFSRDLSPEIIIGSSNGEIIHLKNNKISHKFKNNKSKEFSKVHFINENIFSGGDTKGNLTLFDTRQEKPIKIFSEQSEEITDILFDINKPDFILSTSIDSTLCVYDLKKHSLYALSDNLDEELNCLLSIKGCNHILCGSGEGNILIFNWNWFGDFKDQIRGHPEGINSMDKYNDNIIFTGCEDGGIRICSIYPKGMRGILSSKNNNKKSNFKDVNKIKISKDKKSIITCSGSDCLRLYNISDLNFSDIYKSNNEFYFEDNQEKENINSDDYKEEESEEKINEKLNEKLNEEEDDGEEEEKENKEEDDEEEEEEKEENEEKINEKLNEELNEEEDDGEEEEKENKEEEEDDEEEEEEEKEEEENEDKVRGKKEKIIELYNNKEKQFLNKKKRKDESDKESESENSEIDDESSSSSGKKRKTKKIKKLDKNKRTKSIIDKEERKAFFNDL